MKVLLEYARLITGMEASWGKRDAEWPIAQLDTAHEIDERAKKLRDHKYEAGGSVDGNSMES